MELPGPRIVVNCSPDPIALIDENENPVLSEDGEPVLVVPFPVPELVPLTKKEEAAILKRAKDNDVPRVEPVDRIAELERVVADLQARLK